MQAIPSLDFIPPKPKELWAFATMLQKSWRNLTTLINNKIGFGDGTLHDNIDGVWANVAAPVAPNTDFTITHNLGRIPVGYWVMQKDRACDVYTGSVAPTSSQLTLRASVASAVLRLFIIGLLFALLGDFTQAQTTVNLTVQDTNSTLWTGPWTVSILPPSGIVPPPTPMLVFGGGSLATQTGTLSGGTAAISLPANVNVVPSGTHWLFNVCFTTTGPCFTQQVTVSSTSPMTLTLVPPPPTSTSAVSGNVPVQGTTITGATYTIGATSFSETQLQPDIFTNTGGGGVTITVPTATSLGNPTAGIIIRCQTIPAATCTVNFTTWLVNSAMCAPASTSPCSQILLGANQQLVLSVNKLGGAWDGGPGGMVNGANTSAQVPVTCAPSASLPFSPLPQVFVTDFFIQLTQNCTITSVTGPFTAGSEIVITTINNGGFTLGFPANFINTPPIQTGVNAYNAMTFQYCGSVGTVACPAGDWNNTDIGPAGALPTLDAVLNPVNNASFTFPATEGLTVAGTQPASVSGAGTAAGTLVTMTAPKGGNSTSGTGGQGGGFVWQPGTGGDSTTGRGQGGFAQFLMPLSGAAGSGAALPGRFLADYNSAGNTNGTWTGASASAPGGGSAGIFSRNTSSTVGNTVNNISPILGMSAHMIINNVDTEVQANLVLANGIPGTGSIANVNTNNPDITILLEVPSLSTYAGTLHFELEHGGPAMWCFYVNPSVCGDGGIYNRGAALHIGSATQQQNRIIFQTAGSLGAGANDLTFTGHGNSGLDAGCAGDDNQASNRTWVWCSELNNSSGGNIADGTVVKVGTADSVTPLLTTDTGANIAIGIVIVPGGGNCANATICHVAWGGTLNGIVKVGTASSCTALGMAIIADTTVGGEVKCIAAASATFGTVIGYALSTQSTAGQPIDIAIRIH